MLVYKLSTTNDDDFILFITSEHSKIYKMITKTSAKVQNNTFLYHLFFKITEKLF